MAIIRNSPGSGSGSGYTNNLDTTRIEKRKQASRKRLHEFLLEAEKRHTRLSPFEGAFYVTMKRMYMSNLGYDDLTDNQKNVFNKIEREKLYV